jgi:hypothetical protein
MMSANSKANTSFDKSQNSSISNKESINSITSPKISGKASGGFMTTQQQYADLGSTDAIQINLLKDL